MLLAALGLGMWASPALAVCSNNLAGVPGIAGEVEYFPATNRLMYCDNTNWIDMRGPDSLDAPTSGPTGCPSIGNTCSDGSIYVGISPDGNAPMYMTTAAHETTGPYSVGWAQTGNARCDAGGTVSTCWTGASNTVALAALSPVQTVPQYCNNLTAHGSTDWYLPSRAEVFVMHQMHDSVGSDLIDDYYFSSSEAAGDYVWSVSRNTGHYWHEGFKGNALPARCVRKVLSLNPVGHWRLNETSGTAVVDSGGNGFNGTMQGGMNGSSHSVGGVKGRALNFNGTNNYVNIPHNAAMAVSGSFTVAAWVRSTVDTDENQRIISKWGPGGNVFNLMYSTYDYGGDGDYNQAAFEVALGGTNYLVEAENNVATVADGQWHHLVGVYDGTAIHIYTDGVLRNSRNVSGALAASTAPINFGRDANNYGFFGGNIDDVRLYNRALSAAEISSMMGASCTGAGTVYYDTTRQTFRWCNGSILQDMGPVNLGSSSTCNTGTLAGTLDYSSSNNTYYFCNGEFMVPIGRECTECGGASNKKVAFIQADALGGSRGGIAGADAMCQSEAVSAGLTGTYYAWMADSTAASAPATRFSAAIRGGSFSIVKPNGTTIANNWADLIDGSIASPVNVTAFGATIDSHVYSLVYTNVATNGTRFSATNHCSNFTSISGNVRRGDSRVANSSWTAIGSNGSCSSAGHMYCFEQ